MVKCLYLVWDHISYWNVVICEGLGDTLRHAGFHKPKQRWLTAIVAQK